jgi:hypothetical protein
MRGAAARAYRERERVWERGVGPDMRETAERACGDKYRPFNNNLRISISAAASDIHI